MGLSSADRPGIARPRLFGRLRTTAVSALLVALCLAVFVPGLPNEFVWDDEQYVSRNPHVAGGLSLEDVRWSLTSFDAGNWHPLTWLSHQTDVELFGLNPAGHHLTGLLLHCANATLVFLVFRGMTGAFWGSALVAALFAVHPLHVESVAWAAERKDVLSTLLWLLALGAYVAWCRQPRPARYAAALLLYALSLAAKQMPVTLPFLLLLLDWWPLGRLAPGRRARALTEKLPLFALAALGSAVAYAAQAAAGAVGEAPLAARLANAGRAYWLYLGKTWWPAGLALIYPFPAHPPAAAATVLAGGALVAVSVLVVLLRRNLPFLAVGWFWFLGTMVPVIGIVQVGSHALADRYTYVPLIGVFLMASWAIATFALHGARRTAAAACCAVLVLGVLVALSRAQVRTWRDTPTAFANVIRVTPDNALAHHVLGLYYHERRQASLAIDHFRAAIAIDPGYAEARVGLALALEAEGKTAEAIGEAWAATRADPGLADGFATLGRLLSGTGETFIARWALERAVQLRPTHHEAHARLGELYLRGGDPGAALPHFGEAVRLSPQTALYQSDLGAALAATGRLEEAVPVLQEALRLDPGLQVARENLEKVRARRAAAADRADREP